MKINMKDTETVAFAILAFNISILVMSFISRSSLLSFVLTIFMYMFDKIIIVSESII